MKAPDRKALADELAAMGNARGGTLVFSVSDGGEVRRLSREHMDALEQLVYEICNDAISPALSYNSRRMPLPDGHSALLIQIEQSPHVHSSPGGYLTRQGSSKRELSPQALQRLFQRRGRSGLVGPDELPVAETGRGTLDTKLLDRFLSTRTHQPAEGELAKLGVLVEDDAGVTRATVAGILLATERPDMHIPGAAIEAVRYRGTVLGKAIQHDAATIVGPLDKQIREAVLFARRNTRVAARKVPGRVETPQFSPRAVFEAIVNAVVHRDYSMENAKVRLFIFDDPNKTWMKETTDSFGRVAFGFHSDLPIKVFCAAAGYSGHVERAWRPPDEGKQQPVNFKLNQSLLLTDVQGTEWIVRFIDMFGKSALLEYRPPEQHRHS